MNNKIADSVLAAMASAEKISVIIKVKVDRGNELLALKRELLEGRGVHSKIGKHNCLFCALTSEQIQTLATFQDVERISLEPLADSYD